MNTRENLKRPAYHEAGHVAVIYMLCGDRKRIRSCKVDSIKDDHPEDYKYGGSVDLNDEPITLLDSTKNLPSFQEFNTNFIMACYYYAGGIAEKFMMRDYGLNESSMKADKDFFERRCIRENIGIENKEKLRALAISFCEENIPKIREPLTTIADALIDVSFKHEEGLGMKEIPLIKEFEPAIIKTSEV